MKTIRSRRDDTSRSGERFANRGIHSSQLMELFEDELKDIYWAEKELTKEIPKMIKKATSQDLVDALENHLAHTKEQVKRVEHVFEIPSGSLPKHSDYKAMWE